MVRADPVASSRPSSSDRIMSSSPPFPSSLQCDTRFWANEARYRTAHKEWVDFIDSFLVKLQEVDDEIPYLPAKDVEHRIYRDVRFSNDKTPYKRVSLHLYDRVVLEWLR